MILSCSMIEPGQPWVTTTGSGVGLLRADMDEVDFHAVDFRGELRKGVESRLDLSPVMPAASVCPTNTNVQWISW